MTYKCYEKDFENYPSFKDTGFGFFNSLNMNTKSRVDNSGTYTVNGDTRKYYTIKNLTLAGNVSVDAISHSTGLTITGANQYDTVNQDMYIAAGGLVGATATTRGNNKYILENVDVGALAVSGVKHAGGLLGYGSWNNVEAYSQFIINDCDITNLSVSSTRTTGGLIGYIEKCHVVVNDPAATSVTINSAMSAGGMVGYANTSGSITVNGDTNGGGTNKQYLITAINMTSNNAGGSLYAGGLIGYTAIQAIISNSNFPHPHPPKLPKNTA